MSMYAILIKETGELLTKRTSGSPRLWPSLRGPSQILGKGVRETPTHKIVRFTLVLTEE